MVGLRVCLVAFVLTFGFFSGCFGFGRSECEARRDVRAVSQPILIDGAPSREQLEQGLVTGKGTLDCPYRISNFVFQGPRDVLAELEKAKGFAVAIRNATDAYVVEDNRFLDLPAGAVFVSEARRVRIEGNTFSNYHDGTTLSDCGYLQNNWDGERRDHVNRTIEEPLFASAVTAHGVDDLLIKANRFEASDGVAVHLRRIESVTLEGNTFRDSEQTLCGLRIRHLSLHGNDFGKPHGANVAHAGIIVRDPRDETTPWAPHLERASVSENSFNEISVQLAANLAWSKLNLTVVENRITKGPGFLLGGANIRLDGNVVDTTRLEVSPGDNAVLPPDSVMSFSHNRFNGSGGTIQLVCLDFNIPKPVHAWVENNTFESCPRALEGGYALHLRNNTFRNNKYATTQIGYVEGSGNRFYGNDFGLSGNAGSLSSPFPQTFNHNEFVGNNVSVGGNIDDIPAEGMRTYSPKDAGGYELDLELNWWGCPEGPNHPGCESIPPRKPTQTNGQTVDLYPFDFYPWLTEPLPPLAT